MSPPRRIQRRRTKGWRMPPNTRYAGRPGPWGNPFRVGDPGVPDPAAAVARFAAWLPHQHTLVAAARETLDGVNLACWCPLSQPCHVDVWLRWLAPPVTIVSPLLCDVPAYRPRVGLR